GPRTAWPPSRAAAPDHGAAERRVLLAALAQPQRHGHHPDDHRQGRHQHRASPPVSTRRSLAKLTSRIELDTAMPTAMMEPISDSTFSVVPVRASIQRMPTKAPGTAAMMMNGSTQD